MNQHSCRATSTPPTLTWELGLHVQSRALARANARNHNARGRNHNARGRFNAVSVKDLSALIGWSLTHRMRKL